MAKLVIGQLERGCGGALVEPATDQRRFEQPFFMGQAGGAKIVALLPVIRAQAGISNL